MKMKNFQKEAGIDNDLFKRHIAGDEHARDQLILRQEDKVESVARKHSKWSNGLGYMDLVQEGWIGVMKSLDSYDPDKGVPFNYYVGLWIDTMIRKAIFNTGRTIRTPISTASSISKMKKAEAELRGQLNRDPHDSEVAAAINVSEKKIKKLRILEVKSFSMDQAINDSDGQTSGCLISDMLPVSGENPEDELLHKELISDMLDSLDRCLTSVEKRVILEYYGIGGMVPKTLQEIGDELDYTKPGIKVVRDRAIRKIYKHLQAS